MGKSVFLNIALIIISQIGYLQLLNSKYDLEHRYNSFDYNYSYIDQFIPLPPDYEIWDPGMNHFIIQYIRLDIIKIH